MPSNPLETISNDRSGKSRLIPQNHIPHMKRLFILLLVLLTCGLSMPASAKDRGDKGGRDAGAGDLRIKHRRHRHRHHHHHHHHHHRRAAVIIR